MVSPSLQLRPRMQPFDPAVALPMVPGGSPRAWQVRAAEAIEEALPRWPKILVSAATGTGKGTLIASLAVRWARQGLRVLFLVHRDELIDDVMSRAVAIEKGLPAGKVKGPQNEIEAQAIFASVQSLKPKRLKQLGHVDLMIIDEAHHATAPTYQRVWKRVVEVNPAAKLLGFTATPFRSAPGGETSGLGRAFDAVVFEYSLQEAISDGALAPLECVRVALDLRLEDGQPLSDEEGLSKLLDCDSVNELAVRKYQEHLSGRPAIVFCTSVAHAQNMAAAFRAAGVMAQPVWGEMPARDREDALKLFRERPDLLPVLCNKDLLTEGFDAPQTEGVLLVRPTESRGLFAQMVGRATRKSPGKSRGLVLDFVANSETHSLASFRDLTDPGEQQTASLIKPGCRVKHRTMKSLSDGAVTAVEGDEVLTATVEWGPKNTQQHPVRELIRLVVEGQDEDVFRIVPKVAGVSEFKVMLFGQGTGPREKKEIIGWYCYEPKGKAPLYTAAGGDRAATMRVQVCSDDGERWDAWKVLQLETGSYQPAQLVSGVGLEEAVAVGELAFRVAKIRPKPVDARWQADPATEGQLSALKKWGLKAKEGLSKGEASWLMETLICRMQIAPAKKMARVSPRRGL